LKISFNWLRELAALKPGVTADSVADRLTLAGLEVESIARRGRRRHGEKAFCQGIKGHIGSVVERQPTIVVYKS